MAEQKNRCCGKPIVNYYSRRCERTATVTRDGKHYCWQHDPVRISKECEEAKLARLARYAQEEKEEQEYLARKAKEKLMKQAGIYDLTVDDLHQIIQLGGINKLLMEVFCEKDSSPSQN